MADNINAYEVIRIINSKPLFALAHFERFQSTLKAFDKEDILSYKMFIQLIRSTVEDNSINNGNIRIDAYINKNSKEINFDSKVLVHHYPSKEQYINGIKVVSLIHSRNNPNEKIWDSEIRKKTDRLISENQAYEVIYIDNEEYITEGSRSNIFFIKRNELFTAPLKKILPGITRKYIIDLAQKSDISFYEKDIKLNEINSYDSAFISGTSPKILPVRSFNNVIFDVEGTVLRTLMMKFDEFIEKDIEDFNY